MGKMGSRNSRTIREGSSIDGEVPPADVESPRLRNRRNSSSSGDNSLDERDTNRGSLFRNFRGRKSRKKSHKRNDGMMSDDCSLESSFHCQSEQTLGIDGLLLQTKFTRAELQRMYRGFKNDCPEGYADKETFKRIFSQFFPREESGQYADLVFNAFDLNRRGKLSYESFITRLSMALHGTTEDKLKWMFHLYDVDGDGHISKQDLNTVVSAVHSLIGPSIVVDHAINKQVLRIFEIIDKSDIGYVTEDAFIGNCANDECISQSLAMFDTKR